MTRIVTTTYRYKRPPRKRKAVALEAPAVVTTKRSRRPHVGRKEEAAAERSLLLCTPLRRRRAAQPSTPREAARDHCLHRITRASPANDDREVGDRRRRPAASALKLAARGQAGAAPTTDGDPEMRAWLLRAMQGALAAR